MSLVHLRVIISCVLALLVLCLLCGCGDGGGDAVVTVDGTKITRGEFEERLKHEHGAEALRNMVERIITTDAAKTAGIEVDEARVEFKLKQAELRAGGPDELAEKLARECKTLEMLQEDYTVEALTEQLIALHVEVTDAEIAAHYEEIKDQFAHDEMIKGRFMLLESRENAGAILEVLAEPDADFAGLASALSIDPGTKDDGGDMGWLERDDYAPEITEQAFQRNVGEYTSIIEYADGFAIVLVEGKKPAGHRPLEDVRDQVRSQVLRAKEGQLRPTWAAEQRQTAEIEVIDEELQTPFERLRKQ
ncbi:MAG TPA: peptidyl-prolyl cis-trans isomerase [Armatimonadota bacterium]|nr:peptidyl-prolyl cis-trans isomerase [Armatimonadota bacterium]